MCSGGKSIGLYDVQKSLPANLCSVRLPWLYCLVYNLGKNTLSFIFQNVIEPCVSVLAASHN